MEKTQKEALKKAIQNAKIDELLVDKFIEGLLSICDVSCLSGCAGCCSSGTANRAVAQ